MCRSLKVFIVSRGQISGSPLTYVVVFMFSLFVRRFERYRLTRRITAIGKHNYNLRKDDIVAEN